VQFGFAKIDLAPVYIKRRDELDVATAIATDGSAHDAFDRCASSILVVFDPLHQRAGAVADASDGYAYFLLHAERSPNELLVDRWRVFFRD